MKNYELLLLLPSSYEETSANKLVKELETSILNRYEANVEDIKIIGKKKIAYEIKDTANTFQVQVNISAPTDSIVKIKEKLNLQDDILRYEIYNAKQVVTY
jgi:small subunit ribosomal protein S6